MSTWKIIRTALTGVIIGLMIAFAVGTVMTVNKFVDVMGERKVEAVAPYISGIQNEGQTYTVLSPESLFALEETFLGENGMDLENLTEGQKGNSEISGPVYNENMQATEESIRIQNKILRFHVKANSNSEEDIALKYEVRDAVLFFISDKLDEADSKISAMEILYQYLPEIEEETRKCVKEAGYDYDVEVSVESNFFPIRQYGDIVLPAGTYDALTIRIGAAEGENFWCMLYPSICFTTDSAAVVDSESKEALKEVLSEEEYEEVFINTEARKEGRVKVRFRFLSIFQ